jgi:hypothetical protein
VLSSKSARSLIKLRNTAAGPGKYGSGSKSKPAVIMSQTPSDRMAAVKIGQMCRIQWRSAGQNLRSLGPLKAAALMPKIALRGRENLKLRAIRLRGKNLGLDIGLLRLSDSAANTAVAALTSLAKATVPKLVGR